jgi:hypothetical protein
LRCQCGEPAIADVLAAPAGKHATKRYMSVCCKHRGYRGE